MQIEIYNPTQAQPLPPVKWNYEEVKKWVEDGLEAYKGRVYTDETIGDAKKDRANLNKLAEAIDGKRKEIKELYLRPQEVFETQAKELTALVKAQSAAIDAQVKAYDERRKEAKQKEILNVYTGLIGDLADLVPYERLHNPKWLNVTTSMQSITMDMGAQIGKIMSGLTSIDTLSLDPDIANQVKDVFLRDFDLAAALVEKERLTRQREALARVKAAQEVQSVSKPEPVKAATNVPPTMPVETSTAHENSNVCTGQKLYDVVFRIRVTKEQLNALGSYMKANGIKPEKV